MKPIICAAWSFRGPTEGGEAAIHSPQPAAMDSALAAADLGVADTFSMIGTAAPPDVR